MRWPVKLPQGKVTQQVGITMDLSATFAAIAGAKPPADRPFDGINLLPILADEQPEQSRTLCWRINRTGRQQKAVRHGNWKYIQDGNVEMLFDLTYDIAERRDVSFQNPEVFANLKRRLAAWEADLATEPTEFLVK
jgi:arylsulfatase A-like enzyme